MPLGLTLFTVALQGQIIINEVHYNPCAAQGTNPDCEYIELYNHGPAVDISDYTLSSIITYTFPNPTVFPANSYIVVASDAAISTCFPSMSTTHYFNGNLGDNSETIILSDASGTEVDRITYDDVCSPDADGGCSSIQFIGDPAVDDNSMVCNGAALEAFFCTGPPTPGAANSCCGITEIGMPTEECQSLSAGVDMVFSKCIVPRI